MKVLVLRDITTLKGTLVSLKFISFLSIVNYEQVDSLKHNSPPKKIQHCRLLHVQMSVAISPQNNNHRKMSIHHNWWQQHRRSIISFSFSFFFVFFFFAKLEFFTCPPSKLIFFCFDCDFNLIFFALIATLIGRTCWEKLVKSHLNMTTHHALVNTI